MPSRKNHPSNVKARQRVAIDQVKARISANGNPSSTAPERKQEITEDKRKQRLEQAKHELKLLEKRVM